jgi:hypothetical protein
VPAGARAELRPAERLWHIRPSHQASTVKADRGARRFEYVYGGSLSTVSTVLKGCMRGGDTCDTLETSTSTSNTSRCVNDIYDYYTVTPTFTGGTAPTLTVYMTSGPSAQHCGWRVPSDSDIGRG